jgi:hypothetical protein
MQTRDLAGERQAETYAAGGFRGSLDAIERFEDFLAIGHRHAGATVANIYLRVLPFLAADTFRLALVVIFPGLALGLVRLFS